MSRIRAFRWRSSTSSWNPPKEARRPWPSRGRISSDGASANPKASKAWTASFSDRAATSCATAKSGPNVLWSRPSPAHGSAARWPECGSSRQARCNPNGPISRITSTKWPFWRRPTPRPGSRHSRPTTSPRATRRGRRSAATANSKQRTTASHCSRRRARSGAEAPWP